VAYDARGAVVDLTRANGVSTIYGYSAERGWLEDLETLAGATTVQDFTYQRRADGQILGITSSLFGGSWTYGYDDLKRLTSATNADEPDYSRSYIYDTVDNITYKSDVGSYSYPLPGSARPHGVTAAGTDSYSYDANGNMTSGGGRTLTWDGEDRPIEIDGVTFHYGPDGARWKKVVVATGTTTLTLDEVEIQDAGAVNEVMVKYLPGSARRTAATTLWHHKDHLSSIQAVTDVSGAVALRRIHAPYGKRISDTGSSFREAKDYIGERLDDETGLLYLNARYYDAVLGVFISADPSSPIQSGVGINRYAYSLGNPIFFSDPYGLWATVDVGYYGRDLDPGRDGNYGNSWGNDSISDAQRERLANEHFRGERTRAFRDKLENDRSRSPEEHVTSKARQDARIGGNFGYPEQEVPEEYRDLYEKEFNNQATWNAAATGVAVSRLFGPRTPNAKAAPKPNATTAPGIKIPNDQLKAPPRARGRAPTGIDGKPVELHHRGQNPKGPLDEMTRTDHRGKGNYKENHPNHREPSKVTPEQRRQQREKHWKDEWDKGRFKGM
jgi:RHS repeat-associated protein